MKPFEYNAEEIAKKIKEHKKDIHSEQIFSQIAITFAIRFDCEIFCCWDVEAKEWILFADNGDEYILLNEMGVPTGDDMPYSMVENDRYRFLFSEDNIGQRRTYMGNLKKWVKTLHTFSDPELNFHLLLLHKGELHRFDEFATIAANLPIVNPYSDLIKVTVENGVIKVSKA